MVDLKHYRKWAKTYPNFMTPTIEKLWDCGVYIIELSSGTGMEHEPIFGVTLIKMQGSSYQTCSKEGVNKMFWSKTEALTHIQEVVKPKIQTLCKPVAP